MFLPVYPLPVYSYQCFACQWVSFQNCDHGSRYVMCARNHNAAKCTKTCDTSRICRICGGFHTTKYCRYSSLVKVTPTIPKPTILIITNPLSKTQPALSLPPQQTTFVPNKQSEIKSIHTQTYASAPKNTSNSTINMNQILNLLVSI